MTIVLSTFFNMREKDGNNSNNFAVVVKYTDSKPILLLGITVRDLNISYMYAPQCEQDRQYGVCKCMNNENDFKYTIIQSDTYKNEIKSKAMYFIFPHTF